MKDLPWFGFWIFLSVAWASDAWLASKGVDTYNYSYKTEAEKIIQLSLAKNNCDKEKPSIRGLSFWFNWLRL